jgi:hypothetical protein
MPVGFVIMPVKSEFPTWGGETRLGPIRGRATRHPVVRPIGARHSGARTWTILPPGRRPRHPRALS